MSDLIERQTAIRAITNHDGVVDKSVTKRILVQLPSAQPERKKGKWIPENRTMDAFWVCSSCEFPSEAHAANILYNFCPNCGADMRGNDDAN